MVNLNTVCVAVHHVGVIIAESGRACLRVDVSGAVDPFRLAPHEANAITLITLRQSIISIREYPLTGDWRVVQLIIWPNLVRIVAGLTLLFL